MTTNVELAYMTATELLKQFQAKQLSPVEVLEAQISRYEEVGSQINAVTDTYFDTARIAARESEARYQKGNPLPLDGITCALKDEDGLVGWRMTAGSALMKDNRMEKNTPIVDKLQAAGAVFHLQTTVPELYFLGVTWSKLWGVTRNPWNLKYTVGGSSGGSGAALASGITTLATGSDMGGSIRIPSSFNGVYGFKPPHGRVALAPGVESMPQGTSGPMTRTLTDLALMQNYITGPHTEQMTALRPALEYPREYSDIKGWRIAYSFDQGWAEIDPDVRSNTESAIQLLRDQGAVLEEVKLPWDGVKIREVITKALLSSVMGSMLLGLTHSDRLEELTDYAKFFIEYAKGDAGPIQLTDAQNYAAQMHAEYDALFEQGYRAFVCPSVTTSQIRADLDFTVHKLFVNGKEIDPVSGWLLTPPFNLLYTIPVVNAPTGLDRNHVPTGMQIAARAFDDLTAFQVAAAYSKVAPKFFYGDLMPDFRSVD